jgi:hypothetical protein
MIPVIRGPATYERADRGPIGSTGTRKSAAFGAGEESAAVRQVKRVGKTFHGAEAEGVRAKSAKGSQRPRQDLI